MSNLFLFLWSTQKKNLKFDVSVVQNYFSDVTQTKHLTEVQVLTFINGNFYSTLLTYEEQTGKISKGLN